MVRKPKSALGASKGASHFMVFFIPSVDRDEQPIDQDAWVTRALEFLGRNFGGGTAYPPARGVWRDDGRDGRLVFDQPVIVQCYTSPELIDAHVNEVREFLLAMGTDTRQGAVALVVDKTYFEISIP